MLKPAITIIITADSEHTTGIPAERIRLSGNTKPFKINYLRLFEITVVNGIPENHLAFLIYLFLPPLLWDPFKKILISKSQLCVFPNFCADHERVHYVHVVGFPMMLTFDIECLLYGTIYSSTPGQKFINLTDDIFKCISLNEKYIIPIICSQ